MEKFAIRQVGQIFVCPKNKYVQKKYQTKTMYKIKY